MNIQKCARYLIGAAALGASVVLGSAALSGRQSRFAVDPPISANNTFEARTRLPQMGDHWRGCNQARAAGTAPIYRSEPGYRSEMDGDDDGIACEPRPGT